jgi:hypothetical protein
MMENVDIFKEMTAVEIERIFTHFDKLKLFFEENKGIIQNINAQIKATNPEFKALELNETKVLNDLMKYLKPQDLDQFETSNALKNIHQLYQEMTVLSLEGRSVSNIFRKYKLKLAKSLMEDTTEIVEAYRVLAQQNPHDKRIQEDYKKLEAKYNNMNQSLVFDETIIDAINDIVAH